MNIERVALSDLSPSPINSRKHSPYQVSEMAKSLKAFGQYRPFVIDENSVVLVGHCMLLAMRQMGMREADAFRVSGLSEKQKKKLILADNKIFNIGADDFDGIENLIKESCTDGVFDIPGFEEDALKALCSSVETLTEEALSYGTVTVKENTSGGNPKNAPSFNPSSEASTAPQKDAQCVIPSDTVRIIICPECGTKIRI